MATINGYGRLGTDPELKMIGPDKDKPVAEFRLFLSTLTTKQSETVDKGDWYNVSVWGTFAAAAATLLTKGDPVYLEGTVRTDHWKSENDEDRSSMTIDTRAVFPHLPAIASLDFKPRKSDNTDSEYGANGDSHANTEAPLDENPA